MASIIIVDYGVGNIGNLKNTFESIGFEALLTDDLEVILTSDLVVLPGVGAFEDAMKKLISKGLDKVLLQRAQLGKAILGICLGMQVLCEGSEEYGTEQKGLGWIKGTLKRFEEGTRVPHMGWNTLTFSQRESEWISSQPYVYFVHSYKLMDFDAEQVMAYSDYFGCFPAIVRRGPVTGFQFHPEKSGAYGTRLLRSYMLEQGMEPKDKNKDQFNEKERAR